VPVPLLGLASILGREYANSLPTFKERDDFLKVVSPHTYYGNQLIQYLADKFDPNIGEDIASIQRRSDAMATRPYRMERPENQISQEEYDRQMAEMQKGMNTPEYKEKFENILRDDTYGTIDPAFSRFVGPQELDSARDRAGEYNLPRALESMPVQSNFTPMELEAIRVGMYGNAPEVGPQQESVFISGPGGDFTPVGGAGSDFMPQGGGKGEFDIQTEYEQYLRGGLTGYRR